MYCWPMGPRFNPLDKKVMVTKNLQDMSSKWTSHGVSIKILHANASLIMNEWKIECKWMRNLRCVMCFEYNSHGYVNEHEMTHFFYLLHCSYFPIFFYYLHSGCLIQISREDWFRKRTLLDWCVLKSGPRVIISMYSKVSKFVSGVSEIIILY